MDQPRVSGKKIADDVTMDIGEAEVAPLGADREPRVVDPHLVEERGVEIVDRDGILDDAVAEVVSRTVADPPLIPPPASHIENAFM